MKVPRRDSNQGRGGMYLGFLPLRYFSAGAVTWFVSERVPATGNYMLVSSWDETRRGMVVVAHRRDLCIHSFLV